MEFKVNQQKKKEVTKLVIKNNKTLRNIQLGSRMFIVVMLLFSILYLAINLMSPNLNMVNVQGQPMKDYFNIGSNTVTFVLLSYLVYFVLMRGLKKKASIDLGERVQEELSIEDGTLFYKFRVFFNSDINARIGIKIDLKYNFRGYDLFLKRYEFKNVECYYIEDINNQGIEDVKPKIMDKFIIYDYFEPDLLECILKNK